MICIDVGNSAVKGWLCGDNEITALFSHENRLGDTVLLDVLKTYLRNGTGVRYVSVVSAKNDLIESLCRERNITCEKYDPASDSRITYDYFSPGHDRIAAAAGAASAYAQRDFIIVDAGTAVKIDLVKDCRFIGGVIFPGMALSMRALAANTAQLPDLSLETAAPPGTDTSSCMRAGVFHSFIYSISGFIDYYREHYGAQHCFVTGGFGAAYYTHSGGRAAPLVWDSALIAKALVSWQRP